MRSFLAFILLGLALVQLSGATETEEEKEISLLTNQEELKVQGLADPRRGGKGKRRRGGRGKARSGGKKNKNIKKSGKKCGNGKKCRRNKGKNGSRNLKKGKGKAARSGRCVAGCSALIITMMKALRKQNSYTKQYNRVVNVQSQTEKKGGKKDGYGSDSEDGPLSLLISAGGGNASDLSCAGSKTNQAAINMANLTAKLGTCQEAIGEACNVTNMAVIKEEWINCSIVMKEFKTGVDSCLNGSLSDVKACDCFTKLIPLRNEVIGCEGTELQAAAKSDLLAKKACQVVFGECRANGEEIRPVLAACQAGGSSVDELKAQVGTVLVNAAANAAIIAKTATLAAAAGRKLSKRASVTFDGNTYTLDTCANWAAAALAWFTALDNSLTTDISAAGTTISTATVTCSATDVATLNAVSAKGLAVAAKADLKVSMLQKKLQQITGTTVSAADAQAAAAATSTTVAAVGTTNSARKRRKVFKILAGLKNKL